MNGAQLIAAERERQVTEEGWTPEHDANHDEFELAKAAACYALCDVTNWPWSRDSWKPSLDDPVRDMVKAGALIAAEIDRLQARVPA